MMTNHFDIYQLNEIDKLVNKCKSVYAKDKYAIDTVEKAHIDLMEKILL